MDFLAFVCSRLGKKTGSYDKVDHQSLGCNDLAFHNTSRFWCICVLFEAAQARLQQRYAGDAWCLEVQRSSFLGSTKTCQSWLHACYVYVQCMFLYVKLSCMISIFQHTDTVASGTKMKETFLKTGSFEEVLATVKQIRSKSVKDEDTEKPVTKLMLKEVWKWDEYKP